MIWGDTSLSTVLLQSIINGVLIGGAYALIAVGTTIIFAVMKMINFTSGAFLMLGMYAVWFGCRLFPGLGVYLNLPFAVCLVAVVGYVCFVLTLEPIMRKNPDSAVIVGMGLAYLLQNVVVMVFGAIPLSIDTPIKFSAFNVGSIVFSSPKVIAFAASIVLSLFVGFLLNQTSFGRCMRAASESTDISQMLGINTKMVYAGAWTLGVGLMAVAGVLLAPSYIIMNSVANVFRNTAMIAVILGGLGNVKGAFISGIMLGVIESVAGVYISLDFGPAALYILFLICIRIKPLGLFGKGGRIA